jgi:predicted NBD/HSP70 family sugar kinase/biotin operon repressor
MSVNGDSTAGAVLATLIDSEPLTRPELADRTGFSRPTIAEAVRRLTDAGLIVEAGVRRGGLGRVPTCYRLAPTAGYVIAVDIGGNNLRVAVADLTGQVHLERRQATRGTGAREVAAQTARMVRAAMDSTGTGMGPLRRVGVAAPGVIHADGRTMSTAHNLGDDGPFDLLTPLEAAVGGPVVLDNNVNLAALGERWRGHGRDVSTFLFLAVGAGIGMGLVHNGEVLRGAHGAAGEVAYLPLPGALPVGERTGHGRELLAAEAGGYGMLAAVAANHDWPGPRPSTVEELFAQSATGVAAARELVEAEGRQLGLTVASACAVFDPELVVLGGGIGSNAALLPLVRDTVRALVPFPPRLETSALGEVASLTGALSIAVAGAREDLIGSLAATGGEPDRADSGPPAPRTPAARAG